MEPIFVILLPCLSRPHDVHPSLAVVVLHISSLVPQHQSPCQWSPLSAFRTALPRHCRPPCSTTSRSARGHIPFLYPPRLSYCLAADRPVAAGMLEDLDIKSALRGGCVDAGARFPVCGMQLGDDPMPSAPVLLAHLNPASVVPDPSRSRRIALDGRYPRISMKAFCVILLLRLPLPLASPSLALSSSA
ncbi:hypothetical protein B0H13DRAFT_2662766 [Mycena leptocephala]|nr:hypothetical protein B0H13DRAFT_2662766 [Mycena leptocephala]